MASFDYLIQYSQIFDDDPPELGTLLKGISRSTLLKAGSYFLGFANEGSAYSDFKDFLEMFFRAENAEIGNHVYKRILKLKETSSNEISFVNPQSILQLFEYSFNNLDETHSQSEAEAEVNTFKAIILLNQINNENQEKGLASTNGLDSGIQLAAISLAMSYPNSEFINYNLFEILIAQLVKAVYLFEFLENRDDTNPLLAAFLNSFNCKDWKEYLSRLLPLVVAVTNVKREGIIHIVIEKNEHFDRDVSFVNNLILSQEELLEEGFDFRAIRSRPLYSLEQGKYTVVYPLFVIEMVFKGLYFKLKQVHDTLPKEQKIKGSNFRSFYCDNFSEQELLYKTLNAIYSRRRYIIQSGSFIKVHFGVVGEPDFYIRNGNYTFLFESKDILIDGNIKSTFDYQQYEFEFSKKLYFDVDDTGKRSKKAVLQLINNVERLLTNQLANDTRYKPHLLKIYPILILHDRQYNVAGLNAIISHWFFNELSSLKEKGLNVERVRPILIIDIDTLILYEEVFKSGNIRLDEIIDKYIEHIKISKKKTFRNQEELNHYVSKSVDPFSLFLTNYINNNHLNKQPKILFDKVVKAFEE
jgi:hypothetical protein